MNGDWQNAFDLVLVFVLIAAFTVMVGVIVLDMLTPSPSEFDDDILAITGECMRSNRTNANDFLSCLYARDITLSVRGDPVVMKVGE